MCPDTAIQLRRELIGHPCIRVPTKQQTDAWKTNRSSFEYRT